MYHFRVELDSLLNNLDAFKVKLVIFQIKSSALQIKLGTLRKGYNSSSKKILHAFL